MKRKTGNKPGRPVISGAYSIMIQSGELPKRRTYIRAYLAEVREALIKDLGPKESDLTAAQRVIINGICSKLSVIRCIEEHIRETGVFVKGQIAPVLAAPYLSYTNSLRVDLQALGINTRKGDEILDLGRYIAANTPEPTPGETAAKLDERVEDGPAAAPEPREAEND